MRRFVMTCALAAVMVLSSSAVADMVLTFEDVGVSSDADIPDGYKGFDWDNFLVKDASSSLTETGYGNGRVSGDWVAYNDSSFGKQALVSSTAFNFVGAYLTGAWNDGLNINVIGYRDGSEVYDTTVVASAFTPTWFEFNYLNVDALRFISSGGTPVSDWAILGSGVQFAMDDFTVSAVPVPGAGLLGLLGLSVAGVKLRKRREG